ncbi:MAG: peptidase C11, partial [Lachnospiraceae bacterium]|nr:peptidase C11 [Lachnospiraceae bacterium]
DIDDYGRLVADTEGTWISINNQPVAYYHTDTVDDGTNYTITGYVPALLNGERVKLILVFDNNTPYGYIAGADPDYDSDVTETKARGLTELKAGDKLDFLCDYYSYDGTFKDSYFLGEQMTVTDNMQISDTYLGSDYIALYKFTDIYNQSHWTSAVPK